MYPMTDAQRNWIYNDITSSDAQWKVLLLHRAAYSAGKNINKPDTLIMRETIIEIVDETGVDLVLSGHDHMYFRTQQVAGDALCEDTVYVTEKFNGEDTTFAVNPEGAVYILPSTAGTKRYGVNENAINPIMDVADACFTTRSEKDENGVETNPYAGGCFSNIEVNGDRLIYKAYVVNDDTKKVTLVDEYAIKKTVAEEDVEDTNLPTDVIGSLDGSVANFFTEFFGVIFTYIAKLIPQLIGGLF
jgi:3',5'-cyclic AMP phosphodiesterase CpdA